MTEGHVAMETVDGFASVCNHPLKTRFLIFFYALNGTHPFLSNGQKLKQKKMMAFGISH